MFATLLVGVALLGQFTPLNAPVGSDIHWHNIGPGGGGWIQSLACDPVRPKVLHVGCDVGGYYRSDDGGRSYRIQNEGLRDYFIESIAVCPTDPRVIVLGAEGGIYKSIDDGRSWRWIRQGFPPPQRYSFAAPIGCVAFDPNDPHVLYAGIGRPRWNKEGQGRIYRSVDQGESWEICTPEGVLAAGAIVSDIEVAPRTNRAPAQSLLSTPEIGKWHPYILVATTQGLYRSEDAGQTWSRVEGLPHEWVQELAIAPSALQVVYATLRTTARDEEPWNGGVLRSEDGGVTWELRTEGLPQHVGKRTEAPQMTSNCKEIVVDPWDPDTAYVGDTSWVSAGVYKTTDGGQHWESCAFRRRNESRFAEYGWITVWGPSVECMSISPVQSGHIYFGTSGHIFATENAGESWDQRYCRMLPDGRFSGTGLEVTCAMDLVFDPHQEGRIYLGYNDIGLLITEDGGETFRRCTEGMHHSGNCFTIVPDPAEPTRVWACTGQWASNEGDVCRSTDHGLTWQVVGHVKSGLPNGQTRVLRLDPGSPLAARHLYVTCKGYGVYRSTDNGETWECINGDLPVEAVGGICGLLLDPADAQHIRIALGGSPLTGAGIYETTDGGTRWRKINRSMEFGDIQDLDMGESFDTLYVCQRQLYDRKAIPPVLRPGGLFVSHDGGITWEQLLDYHFTHRLTVSPLDPRVLYVGTTDHPYHDDSIAAGLLKSEDGGRTWQTENSGLSSLQITAITVHPRKDGQADILVGTGGNGVFKGIDSSPLP
ncbi:MAG: WD40/YVTN/BNR-like repeat-containing protein [Candidatus Zipacnadales bacterium]